MKYSIKVSEVKGNKKNVRGFATVVFEDSFKITNIAILEDTEKQKLFVSMPSFKTKERTEHNEAVYKDICNPITSEFRTQLYEDILGMYEEMVMRNEKEMESYVKHPEELKFTVAVSPFERANSNILGLARIYLDDCFVIGNVSILKGKEKEFVAMPSYMARPASGNTPARYQDICYPVTKEFREKLYDEILACYKKERDKGTKEKEQNRANNRNVRSNSTERRRDHPFR